MASVVESGTQRRVKLYMLNEDRQWDDKGTGHISSSFVEAQKGIALIVISELDGSVLLESKIQSDTAYQKQQETLVVWSEGESVDLALSFQEKVGCEEIWEKICRVQGKDPSVEITQEVVDESESEVEMETSGHAFTETFFELPPIDIAHLEELLDVVTSAMSSVLKRERLVVAFERPGCFHHLLEDTFRAAEDLEDKDALQCIHEILRHLIMLNKDSLYKILFADDLIMNVIGVLEYDPTRTVRPKHREFLDKAVFHEVIPLNNAELKAKICQTYRVQYIQDCILPTPSMFEDNALSSLNSFIFFNKVEITSAVMKDEKLMCLLFCQLMEDETDFSRRRDLAYFLKELCSFSQTLQAAQRESFFKTLMSLKALRSVALMLHCEDLMTQSAAVDILTHFVEYSPSMVREFMLAEENEQPSRDDDHLLINIIIKQLIRDTDAELGGALQLCGLLRLLIDPDNMVPTNNSYSRSAMFQRTEKMEFLGFFYRRAVNTLTDPLFANTVNGRLSKDDYRTALLLQYLLEIITFCIEHHSYHMKNFALGKDVIKRVLVLLESRHTFLVLGAVRFFRRVVGLKEEFYNRYITKNGSFRPLFLAFRSNGQRYNLLNSALIELFDFIRQEDIRSLIIHVVENHWEEVQHVVYVNTFKGLKMRYTQIQDRMGRGGLPGVVCAGLGLALQNGSSSSSSFASRLMTSDRFQRDPRSLEEEEESWFDAEDEAATFESDLDSSSTNEVGIDGSSSSSHSDYIGSGDSSILLPIITNRPELMGGWGGFEHIFQRKDASSHYDGKSSSVKEVPTMTRHCPPITIHFKTSRLAPTDDSSGAVVDLQQSPLPSSFLDVDVETVSNELSCNSDAAQLQAESFNEHLVDYKDDSDEVKEAADFIHDNELPHCKRRRTNSTEESAVVHETDASISACSTNTNLHLDDTLIDMNHPPDVE